MDELTIMEAQNQSLKSTNSRGGGPILVELVPVMRESIVAEVKKYASTQHTQGNKEESEGGKGRNERDQKGDESKSGKRPESTQSENCWTVYARRVAGVGGVWNVFPKESPWEDNKGKRSNSLISKKKKKVNPKKLSNKNKKRTKAKIREAIIEYNRDLLAIAGM